MFNEKTFLEKIKECEGMSFINYDREFSRICPRHIPISEYKKVKYYKGGYNNEFIVNIFEIDDDKSIIAIIKRNDLIDHWNQDVEVTDDDVDKICFMLHFNVTDKLSTPETKLYQMRIGKSI